MSPAGSVEPWRCLTESNARHLELPSTPAEHRRLVGALRDVSPGTIVLLTGSAPTAAIRLRRLLKEARLELVGRFLAIPSLASPTYYVADTPGATRYFVDELLAVPRGRPLSTALFSAWRGASRIGAHRALRLLARRRLFVVRTHDKILGSGGSAGLLGVSGMDAIVLALSKDPNAKITVLLLPRGRSMPLFAVKVPTTTAAHRVVEVERNVLERLHERLPSDIAATVPQVVAVDGTSAVALSTAAMPGSPMSTAYHSWRHLASPADVSADFSAVERWLGPFQEATAGAIARCDFGAGFERAICARFDDDANLAAGLGALRRILPRLNDMPLPRTAVHGDFWFGNILLERGVVSGVVDWESAALSGDPLRDLARFALSYALYLDRHSAPGRPVSGHPGLVAGAWGAGVAYALDGQGWFAELFRDFLQRGLARLGGDAHVWREVALAGLVDIAATADHLEFARQHWELFKRLAG